MITQGVFVAILLPSIALANNEQAEKALRYASLAYYKQSGLEKRAKYLERRYIPDPVREYGGWVVWGVGVYQKKMITYRWEF